MSTEELLKKILLQLKRNEVAAVGRFHPHPLPGKFIMQCSAGGSYLGTSMSLADGGKKKCVEWEKPKLGGELYNTILIVEMPDTTEPDVCMTVELDENGETADWSPYEYNKVLGMTTPVAGYGGSLIYDAINKLYGCITFWETRFLSKVKVGVWNYSGVTVEIYVWSVQLYTFRPLIEFE